MDPQKPEKEEIVIKDLRTLAIKAHELSVRPGLRLETPVYITIWPDGEVFIE